MQWFFNDGKGFLKNFDKIFVFSAFGVFNDFSGGRSMNIGKTCPRRREIPYNGAIFERQASLFSKNEVWRHFIKMKGY